MTSAPDYKISFGAVARTLLYEDSEGTICFTFDVDTIKGQQTIILERYWKSMIESEQLRIDFAFERAKEYLASRGYKVEIFGE
jgi:hypothetical protein